jgi:hypothetical protein
MGANITWLQSVSSLVSQLCSRVARADTCNSFVLDDLCNKFCQNTYLRHILLTWVHNGQVGFGKNTTCKKQYMCRIMIMWCQWDFNEQIEQLVRLLLCTSENCLRKFHAWVHFVPSKRRISKVCFYGDELIAPRPTPKLRDHPLPAACEGLFNKFAATNDIGSRSSIRNLRTHYVVVIGTHLLWFDFQFVVLKYRDRDIQNCNLASCFVWVWSLVCYTEGVWEWGAEEGIWA